MKGYYMYCKCCGKKVFSRSGNRKYCDECSFSIRRKQKLESEKRLNKKYKPLDWRKRYNRIKNSEEFIIKAQAKRKVRTALESNAMSKPKFCELCVVKKAKHAHHEDYARPLKVIWLCVRCHSLIHKYKKKVGRVGVNTELLEACKGALDILTSLDENYSYTEEKLEQAIDNALTEGGK